MSGAARRRLAAFMLDRPSISGVATPRPARDFLMPYLHLVDQKHNGVTVRTTARPDRTVPAWGGGGELGRPRPGADPRAQGTSGAVIEVYGSGPAAAAAEETLRRFVGKWRDAGCPSLADWRITIRFEPHAGVDLEWGRYAATTRFENR
jgi:hypothetical protein